MTEREWLECRDQAAMLRQYTDMLDCSLSVDRKLILIAAACVRTWYPVPVKVRGDAEQMEHDADNLPSGRFHGDRPFVNAVYWTGGLSRSPDIIRDIVGNPFRPVELWKERTYYPADDTAPITDKYPASPWLTPAVLSLAHAAYDERLPDGTLDPLRLAVLADALEEAGCETYDGVCPECNGSGELGTLGGKIGCYICAPDHQTRGTGRSNRRLLRCRCGGSYGIVKKDLFPVPLSSCQKCWGDGPPWADVIRGEVLPHPILSHLRSPGPHWRGCHVVDLILGKE